MTFPPPGGGQERVGEPPEEKGAENKKMSYSDRLKTNVRYDQRLKRNILEITLEKTDTAVDIDIDQTAIARMFKTLGIDIETQVEGYQVQYRGRTSLVSVWLSAGISLERFCKDVNIKVATGVMTGIIRPAGKKDVSATVQGSTSIPQTDS